MAYRGPIVDRLKRLLICTGRRKTVIRVDGNTGQSSLATVSTTCNCLDSSPDSVNYQPRLTAAEFKRRRCQRVFGDLSESDPTCHFTTNGDDYSDSVRTLCSCSIEEKMTCRCNKTLLNTAAVRHTNLSCLAEICYLETSDHCAKVEDAPLCYAVARTEDLVVTECRTECRMSNESRKISVDNALICCHHQLNAVTQMDAPHVSNNLTNFAQYQSGKCSATAHQYACQRSPLKVRVLSREFEARSTCTTILTSESTSVEPLIVGCSPKGDAAVGHDEAQVDAAVCKIPLGDIAVCNGGAELTQSSEKIRNSPEICHPVASISENKHANDRFGTLSGELSASLRQGLRGEDLIKRYLDKRDISDSVRARHRQRCGTISASIVDKILRNSTHAATGTAAAAAAATLRARQSKTSSAIATELSDGTVVLSLASSERETRSAPVVSIVASVAAAANAIAVVARGNVTAGLGHVAITNGCTSTPKEAVVDMRRRNARLAIGHRAANILVPVVMNLRARQREQWAA